jgi:hypothetical protein
MVRNPARLKGKARPSTVVILPATLVLLTMVSVLLYCTYRSNCVSLAEFEDCQRDYCQTLADFLNSPIEWRVVLDVSESYVGRRDGNDLELPSEKISLLLTALPLAERDSVCLDSFDVEYRPGKCLGPLNPPWIERLTTRADYVQKMATALPPPADSAKSHATDFYASLKNIQGRDLSPEAGIRCGSEPRRRYYIFLTDGRHDPTNEQKFQPLFPEGEKTPRFADVSARFVLPRLGPSGICPNLGQLVRGLHFVVDRSAATTDVTQDWSNGQSVLEAFKNTARTTHPTVRPFLPTITLWDPSTGPPDFDDAIRNEVDRREGIYPCIQDGPMTQHLTPHGYPYPKSELLPSSCGRLFDNGYQVAVPPSMLSNGNGNIDLVFYSLQRGRKSEAVRLTLTSEDPLTAKEPNSQRNRTPDEEARRWVPQRVSFILPLSGSDLAAEPLPVKAEYHFGRRAASPPVLTLHLRSANIFSILDYIFRRRGLLPITLATLFPLLCWVFLYATERAGVALTLRYREETAATEGPIEIHHILPRNGVRYLLDNEGKIVGFKEKRPYRIPKETEFSAEGDAVSAFFDVIPFGPVVYCPSWYSKRSAPTFDLLHDIEVPDYEHVSGGILKPNLTWVPDLEGEKYRSGRSSKDLAVGVRRLSVSVYRPSAGFGRLCWL